MADTIFAIRLFTLLLISAFYYESLFSLKYSKPITYSIHISVNITCAVLCQIIYHYFGETGIIRYAAPISMVVNLFVLFFLSNNKKVKILYGWLFLVFIFFIVEYICYLLTSKLLLFFGLNNKNIIEMVETLLLCLLIIGVTLILKNTLRKVVLKIFATLNKGWGYYSICSFTYVLSIYVLGCYPDTYMQESYDRYLQIMLVGVLGFAMYFAFTRTQLDLIKMIETKEKEAAINHQISIWKKEYNAIIKENKHIKEIRHEVRHEIVAMQELIEQKKCAELKEYLNSIMQRIDESVVYKYSSNPVVNAILNGYINPLIKQNIKTKIEVAIPDETNFDIVDLTGVIANLVENASDALKKEEKQEKCFLNLEVYYKEEKLVLSCKNYCSKKPIFNYGLPVTTKKENSGFGTAIVKKIAKKYNGFVDYTWENDTFIVDLVLIEPTKISLNA